MKRDAFVAGGLRIETARDWNGRWFVCWKPTVSVYRRTRKEVLKFAAWPAKTPTGDALRSWLDSLEQMDQERVSKNAEPLTSRADTDNIPVNTDMSVTDTSTSLSPELLATGFGPEVFSGELDETDPQFQTRTVI